jgi:hypothetical protein
LRRMVLGLIETLSSKTGEGSASNVYDMSMGYIMINELLTSSSLRVCLLCCPLQHPYISSRSSWYIPVERGLVGTVVKYLQELTPPEMEHKLRINAKVVCQPKAHRVLLSVVCELLA